MKAFLILWVALLGFSVQAETKLVIPVYTEDGESAADINTQLAKEGLMPDVPDSFIISTADKDVEEKYNEMNKTVRTYTSLLNKASSLRSESIPNQTSKGTCYIGEAGRPVTDLIFSLAGLYYTEQMHLWGWKYQKQSYINEDESGETEEFINENSKLWGKWRGKGQAMLVLIGYTDDGDDVNDIIIPKCK